MWALHGDFRQWRLDASGLRSARRTRCSFGPLRAGTLTSRRSAVGRQEPSPRTPSRAERSPIHPTPRWSRRTPVSQARAISPSTAVGVSSRGHEAANATRRRRDRRPADPSHRHGRERSRGVQGGGLLRLRQWPASARLSTERNELGSGSAISTSASITRCTPAGRRCRPTRLRRSRPSSARRGFRGLPSCLRRRQST